MAKHLSVMRFLSVVLLLDIVLIGLVSFTGTQADTLLSGLLPGTFGPGMGPNMTGNHLLGALILTLDAVLFLFAGFLVLLHDARKALLIGAGGLARLLRGTAGLSQEQIAAASFAVAEEQKSEIQGVHNGRNLVWIGAILLLLAFPAVCFTFAQADGKGAPLLQDAGGAVANTAVSVEDAAIFTADQVADAVLLDAPRVFQWRLTSLTPGHSHRWLRPFVLLFHILNKLVVIASFFAAWRSGHLRAYLLQMAGLEAVPAVASLREVIHRPLEAVALPPEPAPQEDAPKPLAASVLEVPVYVEPPHHETVAEPVPPEETPEPELLAADLPEQSDEDPAAREAAEQEEAEAASVPAVPVEVVHGTPAEDHSGAGAPLALHELKSPDDVAPDSHEPVEAPPGDLPYKNTALHLDTREFDA